MEGNFNMYFCTICHFCKKTPGSQEVVKFCSGCKLVHYCCLNHQKEDWLSHRELCKCMQQILRETGNKHVFVEAKDYDVQDFDSWNELRLTVLNLVKLMLKRPLSIVESQILLFPPVCNFCHTYSSSQMVACVSCFTVLYCSLEHQIQDKKHTESCKYLHLSLVIDRLRFFKQHDVTCFKTKIDSLCLTEFPEKMEECFDSNRGLTNDDILLSEPLSFSLTLVYAVDKVKSDVPKTFLRVHVVGADSMEMLAIETFPIIFNLLPQLTHLTVVMIGPNIPDHFNILVPPVIKDKCTVKVVKMLYHDYVISLGFECPDVIAAYNCGFCEFKEMPEKDDWKNSLSCLLNFKECTIFLTSYTKEESEANLERLSCCKNQPYNVVIKNSINPFCSLYPHRDWEVEGGGVFYVNKYITVLKS